MKRFHTRPTGLHLKLGQWAPLRVDGAATLGVLIALVSEEGCSSVEVVAERYFGKVGLEGVDLLGEDGDDFALVLEAAFDQEELFLCDDESVFLKGG